MKKLMMVIAMLLIPSFCFGAVTVVNTKDIDGTKQWVMIQLTVDGDTVRYTTVQPWNTTQPVLSGQDLTDYCNGREEWYSVNILKSMYPGALWLEFAGDSPFEKFTAWVVAGHTNAAYCTDSQYATQQDCEDNNQRWIPEAVIAKVPWVDSWSITIDATYTRAARTDQLEIKLAATNRRIDRGEMEQTARDLRRRMWALQEHYGEDKAKTLLEYKELEQEREKILRKLKQ